MGMGTSTAGDHGSPDDRLDEMAQELRQLRAKVDELEGRTRPARPAAADSPAPARDGSAAGGATPTDGADGASLTRRRLFRLAGGAAAAGAGLTVAGALTTSQAARADGPDVALGNGTGGTGNNALTVATSITSTATTATVQLLNPTSPQLTLQGATTAGPPTGTHSAGDL